MPGRDVGIEEAGSPAASFLIPGGLIKCPRNVVTKIRVEGITQELEADAGNGKLVGIALLSDRSVFHLASQNFRVPGITDGSPGSVVGAVGIANLRE